LCFSALIIDTVRWLVWQLINQPLKEIDRTLAAAALMARGAREFARL